MAHDKITGAVFLVKHLSSGRMVYKRTIVNKHYCHVSIRVLPCIQPACKVIESLPPEISSTWV
jgi:hypothetical protein